LGECSLLAVLSKEGSLAPSASVVGRAQRWSRVWAFLRLESARLHQRTEAASLRHRHANPQVGSVNPSLLHRLLTFAGDEQLALSSSEAAEVQRALLALRADGGDADGAESTAEGTLPLALTPVVVKEAASRLSHTLANLPTMAPGEGSAALLARLSKATNVAAVLEELGYACAATKEQLVEVRPLSQLSPCSLCPRCTCPERVR